MDLERWRGEARTLVIWSIFSLAQLYSYSPLGKIDLPTTRQSPKQWEEVKVNKAVGLDLRGLIRSRIRILEILAQHITLVQRTLSVMLERRWDEV